MRVMFSDARERVGDYERGKVYDVDEIEAERLVRVKGFFFADDVLAVARPVGVPPTKDPMIKDLGKSDQSSNTTEKSDKGS